MEKRMRTLGLFRDFGDDALARLAPYFEERSVNTGDTVVAQNDRVDELFVVAEGRVESVLALPGSIERSHGDCLPGDFFGEVSLFAGRPSSDTYRAAGPCRLLVLREERLSALMEELPADAVSLIARLLGLTIRNLRASSSFLADVVRWGERASRRVITDELTGVYNRPFLEDALENFFEISKSNGKPVAFLMMDVDNFREINAAVGRERADAVIVRVVGIIRGVISSHGIIARYGGDEFSILLPEADLDRALSIAGEIRAAVQGADFSDIASGLPPVTTSIGVSAFPDTAADLAAFREKADASLYRAKEMGRNRVEAVR